MPDAEIFMANQDYIDYPEGPNAPTPVRKGQTARAGHPIIARTPHLWGPLAVTYELEQPKVEEKVEEKAAPRRAGRA